MANSGSAIGSGIGALAGSVIPGIGTALGGLLGGGIGGLFGGSSGPTPEEQQAAAYRQQAADAATNKYNNLGVYRTLGQNKLMTASAPNLSSVYGGGPNYTPVSSPLLSQANAAQGSTLSSLTDSPDYLAQAKQALSDFDTSQQPVLAAQRRAVGQSAAALGRLGSGGVTTSLGNLQSDYERNRMTTANDLIRNALDQTQQNKYATLGAAQGVGAQAYGQGASERANQQGIAQQGVTNRANQYGAEQATQGQQFNQGYGLANLGNAYDPSGVLLAAGGGAQGAGQFTQNMNNQSANDIGNLFGVAGQVWGNRKKSAGYNGGAGVNEDGG